MNKVPTNICNVIIPEEEVSSMVLTELSNIKVKKLDNTPSTITIIVKPKEDLTDTQITRTFKKLETTNSNLSNISILIR